MALLFLRLVLDERHPGPLALASPPCPWHRSPPREPHSDLRLPEFGDTVVELAKLRTSALVPLPGEVGQRRFIHDGCAHDRLIDDSTTSLCQTSESPATIHQLDD